MRIAKLTPEGRREIEDVARARYALPTDKELERKHGVSRAYIWKLMKAVREKLVGESSRSDVPRNATLPTPQVSDLERLADEVHQAHVNRETYQGPLIPRPFTPRPRPKTALISHAAQAVIAGKRK